MQSWQQQIHNQCQDEGFCHLPEVFSYEQFEDLSRSLGSITRIEDVKLGLSFRGVHNPHPLSFHSDQAYIDYLTWICVEPEPTGAPTLLLDPVKILEEFDLVERELLFEVKMKCPIVQQNGVDWVGHEVFPFRRIEQGREKFFFMPWHTLPIDDPKTDKLWKHFMDLVEAEFKKESFGVELKKGECLFLDNTKLLHARAAMPAESPRHLIRLWVERSKK